MPFVAWGAGIRRPIPDANDRFKVKRVDMEQADVAPLMTSVMGARVPKNSVGKLPADYLDLTPAHKVEAVISVVEQTGAILKKLEANFANYSHAKYNPTTEKERITLPRIRKHVQIGKDDLAVEMAQKLVRSNLEGVEYYHRYYRRHLYFAISASYVGFILLVGLKITFQFTPILEPNPDRNTWSVLTLGLTSASVILFIFSRHNVPSHYLIYYSTPALIWTYLVKVLLGAKIAAGLKFNPVKLLTSFLAFSVILESMVAAFFNRTYLSIAIIVAACVNFKSTQRQCIQDLKNQSFAIRNFSAFET